MSKVMLFLSTACLVVAPALYAAQEARKFNVQVIHVEQHAAPAAAASDVASSSRSVEALQTSSATPYSFYPVAGEIGRDIFLAYYVDLEPLESAVRDWDCGTSTFPEHTGHDPYIRSFVEQEIGVPIFAPLDGTVIRVVDGEPDQNTTSDPGLISNLVILDHGNGHRTIYEHLKRGIPVAVGQTVTAGTEIGRVGSSGPSVGPHIHFESRLNGVPYEPFAGPCNPGPRLVPGQPLSINRNLEILGVALSHQPFSAGRPAPFDDTPRRGTFLTGAATINLQVDAGNIRSNSNYSIILQSPAGGMIQLDSGALSTNSLKRATYSWQLATVLDRPGTWTIHLEVRGERVLSAPFTAVDNFNAIVNRPPFPVSASLSPQEVQPARPALCSVAGPSLINDPDYDIVRYRYRWTRDGEVVRDVVTAARTDVLSSEQVVVNSTLRCEITPSDGQLEAAAGSAEEIVRNIRRRGARLSP